MRDAAVAWAVGHPGRVAQLAVIKFVRIWNVWPNEASLRNWSFRAVLTITYLPVLAAGAVGRLANGWPRLALRHVPAAGRVFHRAAHGFCRFDSLPPAGVVGADRSGGRDGGSMVADRCARRVRIPQVRLRLTDVLGSSSGGA